MRLLFQLLSLPAALAGCSILPDGDTDGSPVPCLCLGETSCVETDAGWFCAPACEAAGDCDEDLTCYEGACVRVCSTAAEPCLYPTTCEDAGVVSVCAEVSR